MTLSSFSVIATALLALTVGAQLVKPAAAEEQIAAPTADASVKESVRVDCTKEVWPNFSPACLRNASSTVVRLITVDRRQ
jgi:hypothetical protein